MLKEILLNAVDKNASDVHISSNQEVGLRVNKNIQLMDMVTTSDQVVEIAKTLAGDRYSELHQLKQIDLGGTIYKLRYRANIYIEKGNIAIAIRLINNEMLSLTELHLPVILQKLLRYSSGLILVTGPTGSGKSTSLAAMINEINETREKHIVTLEDPIEYLHSNVKSIIHQREIGYDLNSFDEGLVSVLRQDPDVIMIGELRNQLAVNTALKASETGHLVISSLHTSSAKSTINRISAMYNAEEVHKIRHLLADSLVAIISQKLIRRADGTGVHPAFEILINTTATANLIRKGEVGQIDSYLMMDQKIGSLPMEKSIELLLKRGIIDKQDIN